MTIMGPRLTVELLREIAAGGTEVVSMPRRAARRARPRTGDRYGRDPAGVRPASALTAFAPQAVTQLERSIVAWRTMLAGRSAR